MHSGRRWEKKAEQCGGLCPCGVASGSEWQVGRWLVSGTVKEHDAGDREKHRLPLTTVLPSSSPTLLTLPVWTVWTVQWNGVWR